MWAMKIGVIALIGAVISVSLAAVLPAQITGAGYGVPSLVGEVTIRTAAGRESYVFKQGERIHFELTVRNLEDGAVKVVYASGATSSFVVVSENVDAVIWSADRGRMFTQMVREREIAPRAIEKHSASWNQRYEDVNGKALSLVQPGVYRVIAESLGCLAISGQCVSVIKTFRIE